MTLTTRFSSKSPVSMAQGRHGELIVVQGGGVRPARWAGSGVAVDAGMDAPQAFAKESLTLDKTPNYYVARVDVHDAGACYYAPPTIAFSPAASGPKARQAKAASYLNQSVVSEIRTTDGGKYYGTQPSVTLGDSHGKGAVLQATLVGGDSYTPDNNPTTGISQWKVVEAPDATGSSETLPRFVGTNLQPLEIPITGNGTFTIANSIGGQRWVRTASWKPVGCGITLDDPGGRGWTKSLQYKVSGYKGGAGAVLRIQWTGDVFLQTCVPQVGSGAIFFDGATNVRDARPKTYGHDYPKDTIRVELNSVYGESAKIVLEGYSGLSPQNTEAPRSPVESITIVDKGDGYLVTPQIKITSDTGFGAYATCTVKDGKIDTVTLENCGGGYKTAPTVEVVAGGAEAFAVSRPHLRGTYQCYYRYVDDTPEDRGGPIPSNLSPVAEVDAGEACTSMTWSVPAPTGRAKKVELWRSTSNEALTIYRVASCNGSFLDDLTDEELRDPDRDGYAAMPIVLPNGEVNANRFGIPPSDKAAVVRFQDRFWYGVDAGGKGPNTIYYSEVDEPESVPDSNEIILQQNARDADSLKAMIPFNSTLLLMQSRHAFSLTFAKTPILDAQVTPIAFRGCLNQRSWDIFSGVCYVLDQYGVYSITPDGAIEDCSAAIEDMFRTRIDFGKSTWSFLLADPKTKTVRAFVAFKGDNSAGYPTRVLCYSIESKTWWMERYPQQITGGTQIKMSNGDFRCVYGAPGGAYLLNEGRSDAGRGAILTVTLTGKGKGYRTPPTVTASGGSGAEFQASINGSGEVTAVWIMNAGYGYKSGDLKFSMPDDPDSTERERPVATYTASSLAVDTPMFPVYRFKSGCAEYITDAQDPKAGSGMSRNIGLTYKPQKTPCELSLRLYYNNSPYPRPNVVQRNRGTGFVHSTVENGARMDMSADLRGTGADSGVVNAVFMGRTMDDMQSGDRQVAVEIVGAQKTSDPVTVYGISIAGTADGK